NHADERNGVTYLQGKVGQAFTFDGVDDYLQITAPALPLGSAPRTIELWFQTPRDLTSSTESSLIQYGVGIHGEMFGLITTGQAPGKLYFWGANLDLAGTTTLQPNSWYHGAVTYNGTTVKLYVNGQLEASRDVALNTVLDANGLTIGFAYGR